MKIFNLPDLGEGLAEAEIREWFVKVGDTVKEDQPLLSMETAKAVVDVPSPYSGEIKKLYGQNGDTIQTHAPLIEFVSQDAPLKKDKGTVVGNLEESETILDEGDVIVGVPQKTSTTIKAMPAVRMLAKQLDVDLTLVQGSGAGGQITAKDVKEYVQGSSSTSTGEALKGVRHAMAKAMANSHKEVVPITLSDDADITNFPADADFTAHLIQAIAKAAEIEPAINVSFNGKKLERQFNSNTNLGLAVDTKEGLLVPVIKDIANKSKEELRTEINHLKNGAKDRSLKPEELQGATFTLSNFGVFAGKYATLVVVPPQVAILGCGKIREVAKVHEGSVKVRKIAPLSLSCDHRAVTGGEATRFLAAVIQHLES